MIFFCFICVKVSIACCALKVSYYAGIYCVFMWPLTVWIALSWQVPVVVGIEREVNLSDLGVAGL